MRLLVPSHVLSAVVRVLTTFAPTVTITLDPETERVTLGGCAAEASAFFEVALTPEAVLSADGPLSITLPDKPLSAIAQTWRRDGRVELDTAELQVDEAEAGAYAATLRHWHTSADMGRRPHALWTVRRWMDPVVRPRLEGYTPMGLLCVPLSVLREDVAHVRSACYTNPEKSVLTFRFPGTDVVEITTQNAMAGALVRHVHGESLSVGPLRRGRNDVASGEVTCEVSSPGYSPDEAHFTLAEWEYVLRVAAQLSLTVAVQICARESLRVAILEMPLNRVGADGTYTAWIAGIEPEM